MRWLTLALVLVAGCHLRPREAMSSDPPLDESIEALNLESYWAEEPKHRASCFAPRPVTAFGPVAFEPPPEGRCPVHVRINDAGLTAEARDAFDAHPLNEEVPLPYRVGTRRVVRVEDGYLVAYTGPFDAETYWLSEDGEERRFVSRARLVGFARAPSGVVLALGVGHARLGRGGVIALDHVGRGEYVPRLVATLPLEPSPIAFDDGGSLVTFAQGFVVRIDERGKIENLHYIARDIGRVASIARSKRGELFLGVECGVLRVTDDLFGPREEFWSARSGASGRWDGCR